jgi:protein-tyrosine kinase
MERLQAAIQNAREQRKTLGAQVAPAPAAPEAAVPAPGTEVAWAALLPFEPNMKLLRRNRIVATEGSVEATPYDMLRTRILHRIHKEAWTRVLVTSPNRGCGKSTTCGNLAVSFGRNPGLRTILIDLDLRQPSIGKLFGHAGRSSFHSVLEDRVSFEEHAVRIGANLAICTNRTPVRNPSELLQSDRTAEILDEITRTYQPDVILFDLPPMQSNDDTMSFIRKTDCAILIAAAESSTIEQIDVCERDIAGQVPMLGVVLNKCRYMGKKNSYEYGPY